MIAYLIKSGLCLALLLAFYHLVLEREKMHQFNRFYLLGSVLFSFVAPLIVIYVEAAPLVTEEIAAVNFTEVSQNSKATISESTPFDYTQVLIWGYLFISTVLLTRFVKSLVDIFFKIRNNEIVPYQKAKLVLVSDAILPHTFWNYIFINKEEYHSKKVEKELFTHELTHVTQKHTLDVLLIEILQIVLWFNPFFYPLKKAIQLNHEFLADDKVIASHQDIPKYQYLLLDKAAWKNKYYLASNLNYSLTKKRLLMMKTPNSKSTILWKKLAIVPLMGGLIFLFADRVEAQSKKKKPQIIEAKKEGKGATKEQMREYYTLMETSQKKKMFKMKDVEKMKYIYSIMSEEQQLLVTDVADVLPPPPPPAPPAKVSARKYKVLKDGSKYAVWIDEKPVSNKELDKYSHKDFYAYSESFVHKNARSKRFPQANQVYLYTEDYYKSGKAEQIILIKPPKPIKIEVVEKKDTPPPPPRVKKDQKDLPPPPPPANATKKQVEIYKKALALYEKSAKDKKEELKEKIRVIKVRDKEKQEKLKAREKKKEVQKKMLVELKKQDLVLREKIKQRQEKLKKKSAKKGTKVIELIEEERELPTVIEIKEVLEEVEEEELAEKVELMEVVEQVPQEEEVEIVEKFVTVTGPEIKEEQEIEDLEKELKKLYKDLVKNKAIFYLNGKKTTAKKVKKYFYDKQDKLENIDITKGKTEIVKVTLKKK
jgi:hypothetical protein